MKSAEHVVDLLIVGQTIEALFAAQMATMQGLSVGLIYANGTESDHVPDLPQAFLNPQDFSLLSHYSVDFLVELFGPIFPGHFVPTQIVDHVLLYKKSSHQDLDGLFLKISDHWKGLRDVDGLSALSNVPGINLQKISQEKHYTEVFRGFVLPKFPMLDHFHIKSSILDFLTYRLEERLVADIDQIQWDGLSKLRIINKKDDHYFQVRGKTLIFLDHDLQRNALTFGLDQIKSLEPNFEAIKSDQKQREISLNSKHFRWEHYQLQSREKIKPNQSILFQDSWVRSVPSTPYMLEVTCVEAVEKETRQGTLQSTKSLSHLQELTHDLFKWSSLSITGYKEGLYRCSSKRKTNPSTTGPLVPKTSSDLRIALTETIDLIHSVLKESLG